MNLHSIEKTDAEKILIFLRSTYNGRFEFEIRDDVIWERNLISEHHNWHRQTMPPQWWFTSPTYQRWIVSQSESIWVDASGHRHIVGEMTDQHLLNVIRRFRNIYTTNTTMQVRLNNVQDEAVRRGLV